MHRTRANKVHDYDSFKSSDWYSNDKDHPAGSVVAAALNDNIHEAEHILNRVKYRGVDSRTGQVPYGNTTLQVADLPPDRLDMAGIKTVKSVNNGVPRTTWKLIKGRLVQVG